MSYKQKHGAGSRRRFSSSVKFTLEEGEESLSALISSHEASETWVWRWKPSSHEAWRSWCNAATSVPTPVSVRICVKVGGARRLVLACVSARSTCSRKKHGQKKKTSSSNPDWWFQSWSSLSSTGGWMNGWMDGWADGCSLCKRRGETGSTQREGNFSS